MRVFIAGFCHESSSFSPIPTSRRSYEELYHYRPVDGQPDDKAIALNGYGSFVRCALAHEDEVVLSTFTFAQPSGPTVQADYEALRDEILDDLKNGGEFDAVLLFLHGAQMAEGYDDCEGDVLTRVREIVGPQAFVGAVLDLHANVSDVMLEQANALVACLEYPHIDFNERSEHLYDIARDYVTSGTTLQTHYKRIPVLSMYYTTEPQMSAVNDEAIRVQNLDGIASVSLIHGFPWADIPDVGAGVLIITNEDKNVSEHLDDLAGRFFAVKEETPAKRMSIEQALFVAETNADAQGPVVIADVCDNAGGGAPSDSTYILSAILERGLTGYALGIFWDQVAVQMAFDIGEGATFKLRIGGKCGRVSGSPLDVIATVKQLIPKMSQNGIGSTHRVGRAALLEVAGNYIVAGTIRGQVFSPTCFTDFGLDLSTMKGVVVKSTQHFYDQFSPIASEVVYCDTPAALTLNFTPDMYENIVRPMWPLDQIEWPGAGSRLRS